MKVLTHYSLRGSAFCLLLFCFLLFCLLPICAVQGQEGTNEKIGFEFFNNWYRTSEDSINNHFRENVNVNCGIGLDWQNEKNAVVKIQTNDKGRCTGALINTTTNGSDNRYYILTANHCLTDENGYQTNPADWIFYWHFEGQGCANPSSNPPLITTKGARIVARGVYADFMLLELCEGPAEKWDIAPYYLGWDNSGDVQTGNVVIHHPGGTVKKIKAYYYTIKHQNKLFQFCGGIMHESLPAYWLVEYGSGGVQGGSSGAPLLNFDRKVIGQLYGHPGGVAGPLHRAYGKFSCSWEGRCNEGPTKRLSDWLDPLGIEPTTWEGRGCQKTIRLDRMLSFSRTYHAVQNIISKQKIESESTIVYKAGNDIHLIEGFHAKAGSNFHALIETLEGCDNLAPPPPPPKASQNETITTKELDTDSFQLFPNPATNTVTIEGAGIAQVEIYDVYGRKLLEQNAERRTQKELNVSGLQAGVYLVKIYSENNQVVVKRLVIAK